MARLQRLKLFFFENASLSNISSYVQFKMTAEFILAFGLNASQMPTNDNSFFGCQAVISLKDGVRLLLKSGEATFQGNFNGTHTLIYLTRVPVQKINL